MDIKGSLRSQEGRGVLRLEAHLDHSVDKVWSALTQPELISRWYGDIEGDVVVGGDFRLKVPVSGWEGSGHVDECEPKRHYVVRTREDDESFESGQGAAPFDDSIDVTVTPDGAGALVVAEIRGLPMEKVEFYGAGWQMHGETLGAMLAGQGPPTEARFDELVPFYKPLADELRT